MEEKERTPNDQRSDVKNPTSEEYAKDQENQKKQAKEKRLDALSDLMINYPELFNDIGE